MANPPARRSSSSRLHRLVETYTPDGATGRVGLAAVAGPAGIYSLMIAFGFSVNPWIGSLLFVPTTAVLGILLTVVTALTLWPVYLSSIGRIDSPAEYLREPRDDTTPSPTERLKTEYQNGHLTEDEFEREIEAALEDSERPTPNESSTHRSSASADHGVEEPERSD